MYLKINDGHRDYYFKFDNRKVVTIGRGTKNDIQITAEGVSRYHLKVFIENGEFFVIDEGTTNGSYINDEKIPPHQKTSFNTFFPVQMGFHAKLYLCDESNVDILEKLIAKTQADLEDYN